MAFQKLPIGIQDFRTLIEDGYKYVDKTRYVHQLATTGKFFFLSRPRRFGKSITIATLQELYSGSRELFKGLWIEDKWDWNKRHPVIRITLTGLGYPELTLQEALNRKLNILTEEAGLPITEGTPGNRLEYLIAGLSSKAKVVVLIDEYDAPVIHHLGKDLGKAIEARDILKEFYTVLKNNDHLLEFVFLTGVSKFSKVGIFSGLNNLQDISLHPAYANMLGYTQQELEENFAEEITAAAELMRLSREELLSKMKYWYNGYRFHLNAESVYNPISVNLFFNTGEFQNFWFATSTPTFLINLLKQHGLYDFKLTEQSQLEFDSFDLEDLRPYGLLYQTGYLTIIDRDEAGIYQLGYPNYEVENSMLAYLLDAFGGVPKGSGLVVALRLERAFESDDIEQVMRILTGMFSGLPRQLYEKTPERFYHASLHLLFSYMGLRVHSEVCTIEGRADAVVETSSKVYVLEFKLDQSAEAALEQIRKKRYHQAFWNLGKPVVGLGVNFSSAARNIEDWKAEERG
ncbi:MAG TPA: AAA family ATPase [Saprospiraceae bacterium]|nr:AAA family ATPase [Saprospiraceae bacterium]